MFIAGVMSATPSHTAAFLARIAARQDVEPRTIEIVAKRFAFEPAVVEITQGEPVRLLVRSADGPHGFAIKALKIDRELERGADPVKIDLVAKEAGEFEIVCSVMCGTGHSTMNGKLVVLAGRQEAP